MPSNHPPPPSRTFGLEEFFGNAVESNSKQLMYLDGLKGCELIRFDTGDKVITGLSFKVCNGGDVLVVTCFLSTFLLTQPFADYGYLFVFFLGINSRQRFFGSFYQATAHEGCQKRQG